MFQAANRMAAQALKEYLRQIHTSVDFEGFTKEQLDNVLERFYANARTQTGELYRGKSLTSICYSLNRHLNAPPPITGDLI